MFHLHQTPWLPEEVTCDNIFFTQKDGVPISTQVFITQQILEPPRASPGGLKTPRSLSLNPGVVRLGILQTETILSKSLHNYGGITELERDFILDYDVAQKILNEVEQYGGPNYGSAVRRCLNRYCYQNSMSFEDRGFRDKIYRGVVAPLEEDLMMATSI
ncbi:hypothetical protein CIB48_g1738 [Xylaria polymorpha]|nr:hypothetical protein CIB48_g1738 [Xylaria polymorpha]